MSEWQMSDDFDIAYRMKSLIEQSTEVVYSFLAHNREFALDLYFFLSLILFLHLYSLSIRNCKKIYENQIIEVQQS